MDEKRDHTTDASPDQVDPPEGRLFESVDLLGSHRSVTIHHDGEYYRLTVTRNGKLLLQK